MSSRVSPAERLRVEIDELFAGGGDLAGAVEQVARLGAQLLLQAAMEAEVGEFLGRERYAAFRQVFWPHLSSRMLAPGWAGPDLAGCWC